MLDIVTTFISIKAPAFNEWKGARLFPYPWEGEMRYLTKSRFTTAITCPTKLTYLDDDSCANSNRNNDFLLALADGGHQIGALAKCMFPEGIEIDAIGHDAQIQQTNAHLARDEVVLFEAAFRVGQLFIRADLLRKQGNRIELYEVKSKSFDSRDGRDQILTRTGIASEFKPYLYDVAFQRHVVQRAIPGATVVSYLVLPDKAMTCPEERLAQRLRIHRAGPRSVHIDIDSSLRDGVLARKMLHVLPVDEFVDLLVSRPLEMGAYIFDFEEGIAELEARLDGSGFEPKATAQCKACEFRTSEATPDLKDGRTQCWTSQFRLTPDLLAKGTIFDLSGFRSSKNVLQAGKISLTELEPEDVKLRYEEDRLSPSHRQWLQCEESRGVLSAPLVLTDLLIKKLGDVTYPLHFIDFETATPALPFHAGRRPYELILFQFSHHRMDSEGNIVHASQHLDVTSGDFPNFSVVRELAKAVGNDSGTIVHWWTHERTVLSKVREQLVSCPQPPADRDLLIAFIESVIGSQESPGRLLDLGLHITQPLTFFPRTGGSSSIKKVLPAILNSCTKLQHRYQSAMYGASDGIPSLNFREQVWVRFDDQGSVVDPYRLLQSRFNDEDLDFMEDKEEGDPIVANGGTAMVAYSLLQGELLDADARKDLQAQLLRYCELDTLAMVMTFEGLCELAASEE